MGAAQIDALSRVLARIGSRRGVLGSLVAAPIGLLAGSDAEDAAARNCEKIKNRKNRQRCRRRNLPPPAAFGCAVDQNSCSDGAIEIACPDKPEGVCNTTFDGFPMCTQGGGPLCINCGRHDTCRDLLGSKSARCIRCPNCAEGFNRACLRAV